MNADNDTKQRLANLKAEQANLESLLDMDMQAPDAWQDFAEGLDVIRREIRDLENKD